MHRLNWKLHSVSLSSSGTQSRNFFYIYKWNKIMTWTVQWLARKKNQLYSSVRPTRDLCLSSNCVCASTPQTSTVCRCVWTAVCGYSIPFSQKLLSVNQPIEFSRITKYKTVQQNKHPCITAHPIQCWSNNNVLCCCHIHICATASLRKAVPGFSLRHIEASKGV